MNDELQLLRDVVRAFVAQRRAMAFASEVMKRRQETGERPSDETIAKMRELSSAYRDLENALERALARLAEVNPELVNG
jgi:hypothetical protein